MIIVGIDNGSTGSIGIIEFDQFQKLVEFRKTPVMPYLNYQKSKAKTISRLDHVQFKLLIESVKNRVGPLAGLHIVVERPATSKFLQSMISGMRFMEAMTIIFEQCGVGYEVIDSKEWQKVMLPNCPKGETKKVSLQVAKRLYPEIDYSSFSDADGLLIADWKLKQLMKLV